MCDGPRLFPFAIHLGYGAVDTGTHVGEVQATRTIGRTRGARPEGVDRPNMIQQSLGEGSSLISGGSTLSRPYLLAMTANVSALVGPGWGYWCVASRHGPLDAGHAHANGG